MQALPMNVEEREQGMDVRTQNGMYIRETVSLAQYCKLFCALMLKHTMYNFYSILNN